MANSDTEVEVKFYLSNRQGMEQKVGALGKLKAPRVLELNLRFDTPDFTLLKNGKLLRLRKDTRARVTYKGAGSIDGGARSRQELEFTVSDFDTAWAVFAALGFEVYMLYEKYRTTYSVGEAEVTLDEMPYGDFLEIEGPDGESIQRIAGELGLRWEQRILESYTVIFDRLRSRLGFTFRDLSFENFKGLKIDPAELSVTAADG